MKKSKSISRSRRKSKSKPKPTTTPEEPSSKPTTTPEEVSVNMASSSSSAEPVTKPDQESTARPNAYSTLSEEEISRRRRLRRLFFGHTSDEEEEDDDEEDDEEEEVEEEWVWTWERIKEYYYAGIHDHSDCEEAEEQRQLESGFYHKVNVKCNEDMLEQRPPSPPRRPPSPPPPPPLELWKIQLNMPSYIERRKRDPLASFWCKSSSKDSDAVSA